jgi:hypothetical protein
LGRKVRLDFDDRVHISAEDRLRRSWLVWLNQYAFIKVHQVRIEFTRNARVGSALEHSIDYESQEVANVLVLSLMHLFREEHMGSIHAAK